ncbi:MAG: flagellar filament capping protein FliD [Treponema sp.]
MNVPGVGAGKYDKLIEALIKKERIPRDTAAEELKKYEQQHEIWRKLNYFSSEIRDKTRELYSFNNPFVEKLVETSNERALTATATRDAREQNFKITIDTVAAADSFLSKEISKDYQVPAGTYTFAVGEKKVSLNWNGGKYKNFVSLINKKGKNILHVSEIKTAKQASSLLFESQITGEAHKLTFSDDALPFALENGLIKENDGIAVQTAKNQAELRPLASETVMFAQQIQPEQNYVLQYSVVITDSPVESSQTAMPAAVTPTAAAQQAALPIDGPDAIHEQPGMLTYSGITVENALSDAGIAVPVSAPQPAAVSVMPVMPQPVREDYSAVSLMTASGALIPLASLENTHEVQTFSVPLGEYGAVRGLQLHNNNSAKTIHISDIKVFDPKATGDYIPVSPVSQAQDASLKFEGITIKREKNDIEDLIPGVTLHLHDKTDKKETIDIKPDTEAAKNAIIELVAKYNRLLAEINIVTNKQPAIIDEITYFTDEERKTAQENLGTLFGNTTLAGFKNKLRQIVSGVYRKNDDTKIRSLIEIGISTKSDTASGMNESRLRGYLEIDEKKLDAALKTSMEDVRYLFGYDTNNDILVDDGVAFQLFSHIDPYIQRGGIFSTYTNTLTAEIKAGKTKIERYDKQLEKKEAELKQKYGTMDGSLRKLQKQSDAINSFNQQNKN